LSSFKIFELNKKENVLAESLNKTKLSFEKTKDIKR